MQGTGPIPAIVGDLYAGTLDSAVWNRAMVSMADLVHGTGTVLFGVNPRTSRILRDEIQRFDRVVVADYRENWAQRTFVSDLVFKCRWAVRTHLKTIFGKTGVRSQSELILRIRRGPGGINALK